MFKDFAGLRIIRPINTVGRKPDGGNLPTEAEKINVLVETKFLTYLKILRDASLNSKDSNVKGSWRHERKRGEACTKMGWQQHAI